MTGGSVFSCQVTSGGEFHLWLSIYNNMHKQGNEGIYGPDNSLPQGVNLYQAVVH